MNNLIYLGGNSILLIMSKQSSDEGQADFAQSELDGDFSRDYQEDYELPVEWNLHHLTISKEALKFFHKHRVLHDFKPLIDQITSTNWLDWNGCEYYKYMVDGLILNLSVAGYGNTQDEQLVMNVARAYMHQLIDGCKGGYRGKLATEVKRTYRMESGQQQGKRGWLRR